MAGLEWTTPNEPDGIELVAQPMEDMDGQWCGTVVSWRDPETDAPCCLPCHGQEQAEAEQQARLWLFRTYGERVIPPEHRGGEFGHG